MNAQLAIWRRRLLRAALAVLLGAVTTVGVAWGRAVLLPRPFVSGDMRRFIVSHGEFEWQVFSLPERRPRKVYIQVRLNVPEASAPARLADLPSSHRPPAWAVPPRTPDDTDIVEIMTTDADGWPFAALRTSGRGTFNRVTRVHTPHAAQGMLIIRKQWLPCEPIAPGVILDTLFYAAPWWLVLVTPGAIKRWRRKRRGACVACGYDLRGLGEGAQCPECGSELAA